MGRKQSFDTAQTIRAARDIFWEHGYAETSVADLEAATGIGVSSLYHAFGSKRGLFDAAVTSYLDEVISPGLAPLRAAHPTPDALLTYLQAARTALAAQTAPIAKEGCLLLNTAASPIGQDPALHERIQEYRTELAAAFERGVRARYPSVSPTKRTQIALCLLALWISALVTIRIDPAAATAALDTALSLIQTLDTAAG